MPAGTVDVAQVLALLGHKTLQLEQLEDQCRLLAEKYNELLAEKKALEQRVAELEKVDI